VAKYTDWDKKHLFNEQNQTILASDGRPLGECRFKGEQEHVELRSAGRNERSRGKTPQSLTVSALQPGGCCPWLKSDKVSLQGKRKYVHAFRNPAARLAHADVEEILTRWVGRVIAIGLLFLSVWGEPASAQSEEARCHPRIVEEFIPAFQRSVAALDFTELTDRWGWQQRELGGLPCDADVLVALLKDTGFEIWEPTMRDGALFISGKLMSEGLLERLLFGKSKVTARIVLRDGMVSSMSIGPDK
jgi:hypothetical protein